MINSVYCVDEEVIETWFTALLQINEKSSIDDLSIEEIENEIDEVKGTIDNEEMWALSDPIHYDDIAIQKVYLSRLENMLILKK